MSGADWLALFGGICLFVSVAVLRRALDVLSAAAAQNALLDRKLRMLQEAIALAKYGARAEAQQLIEDAFELKD